MNCGTQPFMGEQDYGFLSADLKAIGLRLLRLADNPVTERAKPRTSIKSDLQYDLNVVAEYATRIMETRAKRSRLIPQELLGEPAWDMLLFLFVAGVREEPLTTKSASIAANVPQTTALNWLTTLCSEGLVERYRFPEDKRVRFVRLSKRGFSAMSAILTESLEIERGLPQFARSLEDCLFE